MQVSRRPAQRLADRALVLGVAVGVQQHDRHRLGARGPQLPGEAIGGLVVEQDQRAVGRHPLRRREPQLVGHKRRRVRSAQAIELGAALAPECDEVGEALGRDQGGPRAAPLEQRVGRDRHPVGEALDLACGAPGTLERLLDGRHHPL